MRTAQISNITTQQRTTTSRSNTNSDKQDRQLPHPHNGRNCPTRIIQIKPTRHPNIQIPTATSTNNSMSLHIHAQEWLTLMSKISRSNLTQSHKQKKTPYTTHDKWNTTTHDPQHRPHIERYKRILASGRARRGGGIRTVEHVYKGPGVIEPHVDGPVAQPA